VTDAGSEDAVADAPPPEEAEARRLRQERRLEHNRRVHRRRRRRRILVATAVAVVLVLALGGAWFWWTFGGLDRMPDSVGQAGAVAPGTTILLVGSDPSLSAPGRSHRTGWRDDLVRSDLVMVLHLTADHRALYVLSIPADSVVDIPGLGPGTLSDAATSGGSRLVARTVEQLTGVRLDRLAVIDLDALAEMVDLLGGVVVDVPRQACGLPAGPRRLAGQAALDYIALQPCLPRKDLDRVERQQSLLRALMRGAVDGGKVTQPFAMSRMLRAGARHLALEKGFSYPSMLGTLWSMRHLRTSDTTFLTVPVAAKPLATQHGSDYVLLDEQADRQLWTALREDRLAEYLTLHGDAAVLGR
jgi:LCP family protein required for cell wall assembly